MKYRIGIAVHITRRRMIEASTPEAAVLRAIKGVAGRNNRNGIIGSGDVLYVEAENGGEVVGWDTRAVDRAWREGR